MISNRDRRKGVILTGFSTQKSYGKYNTKKKARYDLSDLVLDINKSSNHTSNQTDEDFDISNNSFKIADDSQDVEEGKQDEFHQDEMSTDQDLDISDIPYGRSTIINIAISDDEDDDLMMSSPAKPYIIETTTPKQSKHRSNILHDISPIAVNNSNIYTNEINDKRIPLSSTPNIQRTSSAGLSHLRNRSSLNSNSSKRWSILSFNTEDKENLTTSTKTNKRFSISSSQTSSSSTKDKSKRFSMASVTTSSSKEKSSKRFSITSQASSNSSSGGSFTKYMSKVGNALSTISVNSGEGGSNESTPYKGIQPGVVGMSAGPSLTTVNAPAFNSHYSLNSKRSTQPIQASATISHSTAHGQLSKKFSQSNMRYPLGQDSDSASIMSSNSSLRSSRSRFRLSSLFSSKQSVGSDNESIRSIRPKNSLNDIRKSILSMGLNKKDSMNDLKKLDKTMISLPRPDNDSRIKLKDRLRTSSSILSINSVITRQTTSTITAPLQASEYDSLQMSNLISLSTTKKLLSFETFLNDLELNDDEVLIKFAEASYSEVFAVKNIELNQITKILKIIPFGNETIDQPSIENIKQELRINLKLNSVDGFIKLNNANVVKGSYPTLLLKLWDDFNEFFVSKNYRPEFDSDQNFLVLDLEFGGVDLEKFKLKNWETASNVFWSITEILNNAEEKFQFEHRDLHWGNIVLKDLRFETTKEQLDEEEDEELDIEESFRDLSIIQEEDHHAISSSLNKPKNGLQVKLIDYTLSRMTTENKEIIFTRLDHPDFFKGKGDYQFDIYRFMRNQIKSIQDTNQNNMNDNGEIDWSKSCFINNLYWLHYILDKLLYHKGLKLNKSDKYCENLLYLYKSLDPRKKKLSNVDNKPDFKVNKGKSNVNGRNIKRQVVYFKDFNNCKEVLEFGDFYGLK